MKRTYLFQELKSLVTFIEDHIEEPMPIEGLAAEFALSKSHLMHLFKLMSNQNLSCYIRERKLAVSLEVLKFQKDKIIDIALRFGFEYEQTYIRAFKAAYGITPNQYRSGDHSVTFVKKLELEDVTWLEQGLWLPPYFQEMPKFNILGMPFNLCTSNVHRVWHDELLNYWSTYCTKPEVYPMPSDLWGIAIKTQNKEQPLTYQYGLADTYFSTHNLTPHQNHKVYTIEKAKYAVFRYIGHHSVKELTTLTLQQFIENIIDTWYKALGYSCKNPIRLILDRFPIGLESDNYCEYYVYIPLAQIESQSIISIDCL